jgi:hypothetical protein
VRGVGAALVIIASLGCAGSLDPKEFPAAGSGGGGGGGGPTATCAGDLDGATIVRKSCAVVGCHDAADANLSGAGLDLTLDATIGSRLVGVTSPGDTDAGSVCGGNQEPYLNASSSPATGLLIDKVASNVPCGRRMPLGGALTSQQQSCLVAWATTLTTPNQ